MIPSASLHIHLQQCHEQSFNWPLGYSVYSYYVELLVTKIIRVFMCGIPYCMNGLEDTLRSSEPGLVELEQDKLRWINLSPN
jgi:hypothetical protein